MQHPKYKIIFNGHHDLTAFEKEVMANMKTGWIPVGGIAVDKGALYQAMMVPAVMTFTIPKSK